MRGVTSGAFPESRYNAAGLQLDRNIVRDSHRPAVSGGAISLPDVDRLIAASIDWVSIDHSIAIHQLVGSIGDADSALSGVNQRVTEELSVVGS